LNLTERTNKVFNFHRRYHPLAVGYEKYGKDSDVEHIEYCMNHENYRFNITELGGLTPKIDRIRRLVPVFEQGRFYIPEHLTYSDHEGKPKDLIHELIHEEYKAFPVGVHDDILDCMARIVHEDLHAVFPKTQTWKPKVVPIRSGKPELAWMGV
jgi:phage terminase large subunit-like protein